jgi:hypothetical protein
LPDVVTTADAGSTGYAHPGYAASLREFGTPIELSGSSGWLLTRRVDETADDATCYPYLVCTNWGALASDLEQLADTAVSIAVVPDPFGAFSLEQLQQAFPDRVSPFKDHHVADLTQSVDRIVSRHHRKAAERALRTIDVEFVHRPVDYLDDWMHLWTGAVTRFGMTGMRAFSRPSFERQLDLPGAWMSLARHEGTLVAAHVQMVHRGVVHAHVAAAGETANRLGAAYALYLREIEFFRERGDAEWIDWGGGAGTAGTSSGLTEFKQGWSTGTRVVYFCGRINDRRRYDELARQAGADLADPFFPAYRRADAR